MLAFGKKAAVDFCAYSFQPVKYYRKFWLVKEMFHPAFEIYRPVLIEDSLKTLKK